MAFLPAGDHLSVFIPQAGAQGRLRPIEDPAQEADGFSGQGMATGREREGDFTPEIADLREGSSLRRRSFRIIEVTFDKDRSEPGTEIDAGERPIPSEWSSSRSGRWLGVRSRIQVAWRPAHSWHRRACRGAGGGMARDLGASVSVSISISIPLSLSVFVTGSVSIVLIATESES